jgi:hypothetical protein
LNEDEEELKKCRSESESFEKNEENVTPLFRSHDFAAALDEKACSQLFEKLINSIIFFSF